MLTDDDELWRRMAGVLHVGANPKPYTINPHPGPVHAVIDLIEIEIFLSEATSG
jgi:hypothetical protein